VFETLRLNCFLEFVIKFDTLRLNVFLFKLVTDPLKFEFGFDTDRLNIFNCLVVVDGLDTDLFNRRVGLDTDLFNRRVGLDIFPNDEIDLLSFLGILFIY
jgi:hypothetical protein